MKTLTDVLRQADPAGSESRSSQARAVTRSAVLSGPQHHLYKDQPVSRRRSLALAVVVGALFIAAIVFGWRRASVDVAAMRFEARLAESNQTILVNSDIQTATVVGLHDKESVLGQASSSFGVEITFTPGGAEKMRDATRLHVGEHLQLLIDGQVVMAPLIRAPISTSAMLSGNYTRDEAARIVDGLMKGKLELRNEK